MYTLVLYCPAVQHICSFILDAFLLLRTKMYVLIFTTGFLLPLKEITVLQESQPLDLVTTFSVVQGPGYLTDR